MKVILTDKDAKEMISDVVLEENLNETSSIVLATRYNNIYSEASGLIAVAVNDDYKLWQGKLRAKKKVQ